YCWRNPVGGAFSRNLGKVECAGKTNPRLQPPPDEFASSITFDEAGGCADRNEQESRGKRRLPPGVTALDHRKCERARLPVNLTAAAPQSRASAGQGGPLRP